MNTGKTIALTIWSFVSKVISLLFNMLSRFVVTFSSTVTIRLILNTLMVKIFLISSSSLRLSNPQCQF